MVESVSCFMKLLVQVRINILNRSQRFSNFLERYVWMRCTAVSAFSFYLVYALVELMLFIVMLHKFNGQRHFLRVENFFYK